MDAVLWYCNENGIDEGTVGNLISKSLKEKIKLVEVAGIIVFIFGVTMMLLFK